MLKKLIKSIFSVRESETYNKAMADGYIRDKKEAEEKRQLRLKKEQDFARMTEVLDRRRI